jgi:bacteriorhodopsin
LNLLPFFSYRISIPFLPTNSLPVHHYVTWAFTTPLMVYVLSHISAMSNRRLLRILAVDILMFPTVRNKKIEKKIQ